MIGPEQDEDLGCNLGFCEGVDCVETLADVQRRKYFCVTMPKTNAKTLKLGTASKELAPIYPPPRFCMSGHLCRPGCQTWWHLLQMKRVMRWCSLCLWGYRDTCASPRRPACNLDTMRDKVLRRMQSTREHPPAVDVDPEQYRLARCNFQMSLLLAFALFHLDLASTTCIPVSCRLNLLQSIALSSHVSLSALDQEEEHPLILRSEEPCLWMPSGKPTWGHFELMCPCLDSHVLMIMWCILSYFAWLVFV